MAEISPHTRYLPGLLLCHALFILRVLCQLLQLVHPVSLLPPFESWHSGALPYGWLLCSQLAIITAFSLVVRGFFRRSTLPRRRVGRWLITFGSLYFGVMMVRLIAGLTIAGTHPWFGATIPAFFHLVLASFLLLCGHFHWIYGDET